jgi:hypothetical protein
MKKIFNLASINLMMFMLVLLTGFGACDKPEETLPLGKVSVYKLSDIGVGDITVFIDGSNKGKIYDWQYSAGIPECGSSSTFVLDFGSEDSYQFLAIAEDGSEWQKVVTIKEDDGCEPIALMLGNRSKVPTPNSGKGELVFWESSSTGCSGTTVVTINGTTNNITNFSSSAPSCGSSGNATFSLDPGTYSYTATCSGDTKSGTVIVTSNQCTPVQINWTIAPPPSGQGQVVFWETNSTGCNGITEVVINGVTKYISTFSASTPQCGSTGNATFSLPQGVYSYTANCSGTIKTGTVSIVANQCNPVQINWNSGGGNPSGYSCQGGSCNYVTSNAQYSTISACQSDCGQSSGSTITFVNNAFTPTEITFGGITQTAPAGGSAIFSGNPGAWQTGSASTSGKTVEGNQVGNKLTWNLSYQFPNSGNQTINLNVGSDYFFIKVRNNGTKPLTKFYVNHGLQSQTLDNISIANDNVVRNIGYYKAWSNSNVRAELQGGTQYVYWNQGTHFTLPFTINQSTTLVNTFLLELESQ